MSRKLPEYMVPAAFVSLPAIPLSSNGKVDRRSLERTQVKTASTRTYVAPRNGTEKQLVAIWAEVLKQVPEKIGVNDSFFELGGHSLSAVQLMAKINRQFNQSLPLAVIFTAPNIAALAMLISSKAATSLDILIPLQTNGSAPPIFGIPGVEGHVWSLRPLSQALGANQPFYGFQAVGLDGKVSPWNSVEQTAQANVAALKMVQPQGAYRLIGHSYGGVVAYEMARILLEQGKEISSLILLDSIAPSAMGEEAAADEASELFQVCTTAANLSDMHLDIDLDRLRQSSKDQNIQYIVGLLKSRGLEMTPEQFGAFYSVYRANQLCYRTYKPLMLTHQIDVWLYRAAPVDEGGPTMPRDYGWNQLLQKPIRVCDVEADHFSIVRKVHTHGLAEALHLSTKLEVSQSLPVVSRYSASYSTQS
jgi:thioesterase domain-containing protein/acyl carrier protein